MMRWTGLAPRESEFPFPGSLASTFLRVADWGWGLSTFGRALVGRDLGLEHEGVGLAVRHERKR